MTLAHGRSIGRRRQKISNFEKEAEEACSAGRRKNFSKNATVG
jgi:hypothetical protein